MASQNLTWSEWILQGSGWTTRYTASATITVTRATGSDTATVDISATMKTTSGDSNSQGWDCVIGVGGQDQTFNIAGSGTHYQNSQYTKTATYTVNVGAEAGTLTGDVRFHIKGFAGYTGEYSPVQSYSLAYGSKGNSTISSVSKTSVTFGESFNVVINRNASSFREEVGIYYGTNFGEYTTLSGKDASSSTTRSVSIPVSLGEGRGTGFTFKVALKTFDGNTQVGSTYVDSTERSVSFGSSNLSYASNWSSAYFGKSSTITITRPTSYIKETVQLIWNDDTSHPVEIRGYSSGSSTSISYTVPRSSCPVNATTRTCTLRVISYNRSTQVGTRDAVNQTVSIKSDDTSFNPSIGSVTTTVTNTISALGNVAIVGTSKVYAQLPIGSVSTKDGATVSATKIVFPDSKTKTGGNATISETSNAIDRTTYTTTFEVTDSRGLKATKTQSVSAQNIASPTFTTLNVYRGNSVGEPDDTGTYIYALAVPNVAPIVVGGTNVNTAAISATVDGGSSISVTAGTLTQLSSSASSEVSHTVVVTIVDLVHSTSVTKTVSSESVSFNIRNGGRGVGIGKYSTADEVIDIAYPIHTDGDVVFKNVQGTLPVGSSYSIDNRGKGLTTYYITYHSKSGGTNSDYHAGVVVLYEDEIISENGFVGLTTGISGGTFNISLTAGDKELVYRVFENNLGDCL